MDQEQVLFWRIGH